MELYNYIIAGSGPAGVAAARMLKGDGVCLIDPGELPKYEFPYNTLTEALASGSRENLLGPHWEMLANLIDPNRAHPKLRSAGICHVAEGEPFFVHGADGREILRSRGSFAAGGMSNAWGAQLFRYTQTDLDEVGDWPIGIEMLGKYYGDLEHHIGFSGTKDDMSEFLGEEPQGIMPPIPVVPSAQYLLDRYERIRKKSIRSGFTMGRSRLAILTESYHGYPPYQFGETEFFSTRQDGIYTATRTLDELNATGQMEYRSGWKLVSYRELPDVVEVDIESCTSHERATIRTRHLLLGCGTTHTTRLVLLNKEAKGRRLPFLDHPPTLIPFFLPKMFGFEVKDGNFPVQLVATLREGNARDMISFYYPGALLRSDLLPDIPLPVDSALGLLGLLLGGMLVAQIWETSRPVSGNSIGLDQDEKLRIDYKELHPYPRLGKLIRAMRDLGAFSIPRLAAISKPGWGFHYAATLPMRSLPREFETHTDGRLWDSKRVRLIDGSVLPSLPAKNHSLTLMANAARIAEETQRCGY